jgi:hypothetical protein
MKNLILSSLSILGGLTTVHAQHWVPYGFYAFKENPKKAEVQEQAPSVMEQELMIVEAAESEAMIADFAEFESDLLSFEDPNSKYYADPDLTYGSKNVQKQPKTKAPKKVKECSARRCVENWWIEGDYLLVWMKKGDIRTPLITTGELTDPVPGAYRQPNTHVAFGNQHYNYHRKSGVKGSIGGFIGTEGEFAFDVDGFWVFTTEKHFSIVSDAAGNPLIARPFFDVRTGRENAELVSKPGFYSGSSKALVKTQFWGGEVNFGYRPCKNTTWGDLSLGFRYLHLREKLRIRDEMDPFTTPSGLSFNGAASPHLVNPPDTLKDEDEFRTTNNFYGGQVGIRAEFANCWASFDIYGKVAFGATEEKYKTDGETTWNSSVFGPQYASGGVLVQPNNMVHHKRWKFAYVPEVGVDFGLQPCDHIRVLVGYSFLWWSKVIRPGDQIDRDVNSGQIPSSSTYYTPAAQLPSEHLHDKSFWMQTINFGIMFDF